MSASSPDKKHLGQPSPIQWISAHPGLARLRRLSVFGSYDHGSATLKDLGHVGTCLSGQLNKTTHRKRNKSSHRRGAQKLSPLNGSGTFSLTITHTRAHHGSQTYSPRASKVLTERHKTTHRRHKTTHRHIAKSLIVYARARVRLEGWFFCLYFKSQPNHPDFRRINGERFCEAREDGKVRGFVLTFAWRW